MSVELNHTIVHVSDKSAAAESLAEILGLDPPTSYGPFRVLTLSNGVSLDFADQLGAPDGQHYAFLVSDEDFTAIQQRIVDRGWSFWADPMHEQEGRINTNDGGRGLYWDGPDGHNLEIITVPYGG